MENAQIISTFAKKIYILPSAGAAKGNLRGAANRHAAAVSRFSCPALPSGEASRLRFRFLLTARARAVYDMPMSCSPLQRV